MLEFIHTEPLGGNREVWKERLPKHKVAFDPGEVWMGESRLILTRSTMASGGGVHVVRALGGVGFSRLSFQHQDGGGAPRHDRLTG